MSTDQPLAFVGGTDAESTKKAAAAARTEAERQRLELTRQQSELREQLEQQRKDMEAEFRRKQAELEAQIGPLRKQLAQTEEVMWTMDLYMGRDEEIELLRDGAPAPADTPISVRQKVLAMDEESLVIGLDFSSIDLFTKWLLADNKNLDRVLPDAKGVVVLRATMQQAKTSNAWEDAARNDRNSMSYWLMRNGEKLWLMTVDPKLKIGSRLLPLRTEFVEVFGDLASSGKVKPGSDQWMRLEELANAQRRHYWRIMLVLEGLVQRSPVWHPLPEFGASFTNLRDHESGKIRLIQDDEKSIQLGDGHESFSDWQQRLNAMLRPGLRIIGHWGFGSGFAEETEEALNYRRYNHRLFPSSLLDQRPRDSVPYLIEDRKDAYLVIRYPRTDKVYRTDVPVPGKPGYVYRGEQPVEPTKRMSCKVLPSDSWVLPLDLMELADIDYFLNSREERTKHFVKMVPVLRAARAAKLAEAAEEAPFRVLLGSLLVQAGADAERVEAEVETLVHWWKVANVWSKPLNGEPEHEKRAAESIVAEFRSREAAKDDNLTERMVEAGRRVAGAIAVARGRDGSWRVYVPSPDARDARVFLDVTTIRKNGTLGQTKHETTVAQRSASALVVAWSTEEWGQWNFAANRNHYLSVAEREQVIQDIIGRSTNPICITENYRASEPATRQFAVYTWKGKQRPEDTLPVDNARVLSDDRWERIGLTIFTASRSADGVRVEQQRYLYVNGIASSYGKHQHTDDPTDYFNEKGMKHLPYPQIESERHARLVWEDTKLTLGVELFAGRCRTFAAATRQAADEQRSISHRYASALSSLCDQRSEEGVRQRFIEDYGTDADDIWEVHRASVTLARPKANLPSIVHGLRLAGRPIVGQTLDQIVDTWWQMLQTKIAGMSNHESFQLRSKKKPNVEGFGDLVMPELEENSNDGRD